MKLILGVLLVAATLSGCGSPTADAPNDTASVADVADMTPVQPDAGGDVEPDGGGPSGGGLALGAACRSDDACSDGVCRDWPGGYCTTANCANCPDRCVEGGCAAPCGFGCRAGYLCTPIEDGEQACLPSATGLPHGEPCTSNLDCAGGTCLGWADGYCTKVGCNDDQDSCGQAGSSAVCEQTYDQSLSCLARCDGPDDCRAGYVCDDDIESAAFCRPPEPPVTPPTEFPTTCAPSDNGIVELPFDVSPTARSAQIVSFVPDNFTVSPRAFTTPAGDNVLLNGGNGFDVRNLTFDNQVKPVPLGPRYWERELLQPGAWAMTIATTASEACAYVAEAPPGGRLLSLRVYLVGLDGLNAATAPSDPEMTTVMNTVRTIFETVDIELEQIEFVDARGDVAAIYQFIRTYENLGGLFATSRPRAPDDRMHLNVFFIRDFLLNGLLGVSGGVPGPAGLHGSTGSGVAIAWEAQEDEPTLLGETVAHEIGHFLGLFHTSEANGAQHDLHDDTPECIGSECTSSANLMYPFAVAGGVDITAEQRWVLKTHPLLKSDPACVDCDPLADCDGASCACIGDLVGDGTSCVDVDQCAAGVCDVVANCDDALGSVACECPVGYLGNGFECDNSDECALGIVVCDNDATCTNMPTGAVCDCDPGFSGDGFDCEDIDECAGPSPCSAGGFCNNTPGSFRCDCPVGQAGVPPNCMSIGPANPPTIAVAPNRTCGLKSDGSVLCWGDTTGIGTTRAGPFKEIGVTEFFACGIRVSDSQVECWDAAVPFLPTGAQHRLSCDAESCCSIADSTGNFDCWGNNFRSGLGVAFDVGVNYGTVCTVSGNTGSTWCAGAWSPDLPPGVYNQIAPGLRNDVCGIRTDRSIACQSVTPPSGAFRSLVSQNFEWCAVELTGNVQCWESELSRPVVGPPPSGAFNHIAIAEDHGCGVTTAGITECWGDDTMGQSTVPANYP